MRRGISFGRGLKGWGLEDNGGCALAAVYRAKGTALCPPWGFGEACSGRKSLKWWGGRQLRDRSETCQLLYVVDSMRFEDRGVLRLG